MGFLRFFLAVSVVLTHVSARWELIPGARAVQIFFIISGFYMAMILSEKYGFQGSGLKAFFLNRILRIYPTYLLVLVFAIFWQIICHFSTHSKSPIEFLTFGSFLPFWQRGLFILSNFTLIGIDTVYLFSYSNTFGLLFLINTHSDIMFGPNLILLYRFAIIPQAWSISAELCFYALAPFACFGEGSRAVVLGLISLILSYFITKNYGSSYFFWPASFYLFAVGIISYKLSACVVSYAQLFLGHHTAWLTYVVSVAFLLFVPVVKNRLFEGIFLVSSIFLVPMLFKVTKYNKTDRFLGNLSYSIYCVHMLMFELSRTVIGKLHLSYALLPAFVLISSIIASIALYHFVEARIDQIRGAISLRVKRTSKS